MPTSEPKNEMPIHNLFTREIRPIRNWYEFLERWQAATTLEEMLGLLHVGFSISTERHQHGEKSYGWIDRILFYLTIADGWADDDLLVTPGDNRYRQEKYEFGRDHNGNTIHKTVSQLRQMVAQKAFEILCLNFFKAHAKRAHEERDRQVINSHLESGVAVEPLFSTIVNFFRMEKGSGDRVEVRNLPDRDERSHNETIVVDFVTSVAQFIWEWEERKVESWLKDDEKNKLERANSEMRARFDAAKPWTIELFVKFKRLDLLRDRLLQLDKPCVDKLKEIALRNELRKYLHPVT